MPSPPGTNDTAISVIVACRNERGYIREFLKSIAAQEIGTAPLEVVIAEGHSDDGTRELLQDLIPRFSGKLHIRVIDNPRHFAASGLNLALRSSSGNIILRMDVHTEYAPDYVAQCLRTLTETGAANVGGPALAHGAGYWQQAIALAFRSPFFSGGARFHNPEYEGAVDTVPYGCWLRETLESLGGFDETLVRNQDDELNFRITESGGTVWQSPKIRSWYSPRSSLLALARQYFEYGYWKPAVITKYGKPAKARHLIPAVAAAGLAALAVATFFTPLAQWCLAAIISLYAVVSLIASVASLRFGSARSIPALPLVFATAHVSYATGFLLGWWKNRRPAQAARRELTVEAKTP